jgi:hypothetical protein
LPLPLKNVSPVRMIEVVPEVGDSAASKELPPLQAPVADPEPADKIAPDLRTLIDQKGEAAKPRRLEVILSYSPSNDDRTWRNTLARRVPGVVVEGRLGELVTVLAPPEQALALAQLPIVSTVRLPRPALQQSLAGLDKPGDIRAVLPRSGTERPHRVQITRDVRRAAVLDSDFRGYKEQLGKGLPADTRYVDLTQERNPELQPDPYPKDDQPVGAGTRRALALMQAAPKAQLTLIRVDPAAPYQVEAVARAINGEPVRSESVEQRELEMEIAQQNLDDRREALVQERKLLSTKFPDPTQREFLLKKPKDQRTAAQEEMLKDIQRQEKYLQDQAKLEADERALQQRRAKLQRLLQEQRQLKGIQVVWSGLVWNEGYPLAGSSPLSHYFDDRPFRAALWLQSAGDTAGQTWTGLFRDADGNRVMEFAPAGKKLLPERWTSELNFFGWLPSGGKPTPDLPANAVVRVSVQWREPHDPEFQQAGEDAYRWPLATLRLVVLRQLDPEGSKRPADDLEVVAYTSGLPQRLANDARAATYEQVVEFKVNPAGRYALRVEGMVPAGIRPRGAVALPGTQETWELRPRLFVETVDSASRKAGRVVFLDYATPGVSGLGMPADSREVMPLCAKR